MDHIVQLEHHISLKHCNSSVARFRRSVNASQVIFAFAAIASLALFSSFSMSKSLSSTLSARFLAVGSFVMTKKALFVLSNIIFLFLAADYCCFFTISASTSDIAACEPGGVLAKQAQHYQEVEQCDIQSCVSYSSSLHQKNDSIASETIVPPAKEAGEEGWSKSVIADNTTSSEEQEEQEDVPVTTKLELFRPDEEDSVTLETVIVEAPTCRIAQELEKLEIDELNKKFEEFIQSRRIGWIKEEAYLQWQHV